jgi:HSP20 family molecular chaperone IbpA/uncharacterized protein YndB with AHSA1/START domain
MAKIEKAIEVNAPLRAVYDQWTQFEQFPQFMEGVVEVRQIDATHLHWEVEVAGKKKEWDAEITEQVPDQHISWRTTSGASNAGTVSFKAQAESLTEVSVVMEYDPEGFIENVGDAFGAISRRVEDNLKRFKQFIESRGQATGGWRGEVHQAATAGDATSAARSRVHPFAARSADDDAWAGQASNTRRAQGEGAINVGSASSGNGGAETQTSRSAAQSEHSGGSLEPARAEAFGSELFGSWDEPSSLVRRMSEEMERVLENVLGRAERAAAYERSGLARVWSPQIEVCHQDGNLLICADLPGVKKDDVRVEINEGRLTIEGERREESERAQPGYRRTERIYGRFYRSIPLPNGVDANAARASMHDGVLEITLPAPQRPRGRRVEINGDSERQQSQARM